MQRNDFWRDKKVFITGHTGFKGSWLTIWLEALGAKVIGYALNPQCNKDIFVLSNVSDKIIDIRGDIRNERKLQETFDKYEPEVVFHLAAQPLVRLSYEQPRLTYETNVMGTLHILECIRQCHSVKAGIMITTDKCYENKEQLWGYRENDSMGGYDPYSSSKGCAELLISSYRNSYMNPIRFNEHGKGIASVRAGNVIGGGDWANDRIIPDCIKALEDDKEIKIRNPKAVRPWQHVLEPLFGYMLLAENIYRDPHKFTQGFNFGPEYNTFSSVWQVAEKVIKYYGKGSLVDVSNVRSVHEANLLYLDITKAKQLLNWYPQWDMDTTVSMTVDWYKRYQMESVYDICLEQISKYEASYKLNVEEKLDKEN